MNKITRFDFEQYLLLSLVILLFVFCEETSFAKTGAPLPERLGPNDGIVIAKFIGVQPLSVFNPKWRTLHVSTLEQHSFKISDVAPGQASYSLFLGTLPAGQYQISQLESLGVGPGWLLALMASDFKNVRSLFGTFTVKPGAVTNLGTIIFGIPKESKSPLSVAIITSIPGMQSPLSDIGTEERTKLDGREQISWDQMPDENSSANALKIIQKFARNLSPIQLTISGKVITGGALGLIHEREQDGRWNSKNIGTLDTITYIKELDDGRIFAGTDSGRYYLADPSLNNWQSINVLTHDVAITHLEPMGTLGFAIQISPLEQDNGLGLHKYKILFKPRLEDTGTEKVLLSFDEASAVGRVPILYDGKNLLVYFNYVGFSRRADFYHINSETFEQEKEQVPYWVVDITRISENTLMLERINGLSNFVSISKDNGKTWNHSEAGGPYSFKFVPPDSIYGFRTTSTGWSTNKITLQKSQDEGKTWVSTGNAIEGTGRIRILSLPNNRLLVFTGTKIMSTSDEGNTWNVEWPIE